MAQDIEEFGVNGRLLPATVRLFGHGSTQQQPTKARLEPRSVRGREDRWLPNVVS